MTVQKITTTRRILYRNTVVFAILSAVTTVILLMVLLGVPGARRFRTAIVVAELGLLAVIIYAIVRIQAYERRVTKLINEAGSSFVETDRCPDFYTAKRNKDGDVVCTNRYELPRTGYTFEYVSTPDRPVPHTVRLDTVNGICYKEACKIIDPQAKSKDTYNIPWTTMRPKCRTITDGGSSIISPDENEQKKKCNAGFVL